MAKKTKLLLAILAIVCLTSALFAVVPTASAADVEYVKSTNPTLVASKDPVMLLAWCNNTSYQAIEANGTSLKSTKVFVENDKVTGDVNGNINDTMLWIIGTSGSYLTVQNYSTGKYLYLADWSIKLQDTPGTFQSGHNYLQTTEGSKKYVSVTTASVTYNTTATTLEVYTQKSTAGKATVTFAKGADDVEGSMNEVKVESGTYTLPQCKYTREKHKFVGWIVDEDGTVKQPHDEITISGDITLTAKWEYNVWEVTFSYNGKTYPAFATMDTEDNFSVSNFSTYFSGEEVDDAEFAYWIDENQNRYYIGKNTVTSNITITPVFTHKVTVTLNFNGGHEVSSTYPDGRSYQYAAESRQTISGMGAPERNNYKFLGWKCEQLGDRIVKSNEAYIVADTDMTFYAQWEFEGIMITFKVEGKEDQVVELAKGTQSYVIAINDPTPEDGYRFVGWKLNGETYTKGQTITIGDATELELIAEFAELREVTITLHYGEQTKALIYREGTGNIKFDSEIFKNQFFDSQEEYDEFVVSHTFSGWFKSASFEASSAMTTGYYTIEIGAEDFDLYAKVIQKIAITFDFGHGLGTKVLYVDEHNQVQVPYHSTDIPAYENHRLIGWTTVEGSENVEYAAENGKKVTSTEPITLYAVWKQVGFYITFETEDGEIQETFYIANGQSFRVSDLLGNKLAQFDVAHKRRTWSWGTTTFYDYSDIKPDIDMTLTATYTDILYTITFDVNGGDTPVQSITAIYGATIMLVTPVRNGFHFDGWYTSDGTKFEQTTMPGEYITLTAHWSQLYTITLNANGGEVEPQTVTDVEGAELTLPTPTREGWRFLGWYKADETKFKATTMPAEDITVTARWTKLFTVTFDTNGGSAVQPIENVVAGESITLPTSTKTGYKLVGWLLNGQAFDGTMPAENITLTASWAVDTALVNSKIDALKNATTLEAKFNAIKAVEATLALYTEEEVAELDLTEYSTLKANFNVISANAASDLAVAETVGQSLVANIATAVALVALAVVEILKRRILG